MPYRQPRTAIGTRRHRIVLQSLPTVDDGMGGVAPAYADGWRTVGRAWAAIEPLDERAKEALAAQQLTARHTYLVDVPFRRGIRPTMRVLWEDKTLEIHTVSDDEGRRRRLQLQCAEVQQ